VRRKAEAALERAVPDLADPSVLVLLLVPALAADDESVADDLDGDVVLGIDAGQLDADQGVLTVADGLDGRAEAGARSRSVRTEGAADEGVEVGEERVAPTVTSESRRRCSSWSGPVPTTGSHPGQRESIRLDSGVGFADGEHRQVRLPLSSPNGSSRSRTASRKPTVAARVWKA
jgi:hypothetical protein